MWEFNHKEGWVPKDWCFQTVVLEKTFESPLDSKEIKLANSKGNKAWILIGRTDAIVEAPILWPPDAKYRLIGKDPDAGKDWGQAEKGATEDEMVGWLHWVNGHEFEQTLGDSGGQGILACCSPWDRKELGMTEWLNSKNLTCRQRFWQISKLEWVWVPENFMEQSSTWTSAGKRNNSYLVWVYYYFRSDWAHTCDLKLSLMLTNKERGIPWWSSD